MSTDLHARTTASPADTVEDELAARILKLLVTSEEVLSVDELVRRLGG